jgi:uncharacterized protein YvpB
MANKGKKGNRASAKGRNVKVKARAKKSNGKMYDIPHYPQSEEFTSSAACAMMVLKFLNKNFKIKKDEEFAIWQEAVNGSVWHGSRYGLAYALAKRGAKTQILSNAKKEGYEKKLAVFEGINVDTLHASFEEIKQKTKDMKIKETARPTSIEAIKRSLNGGQIPIVVVNASALNPVESAPHWVVVKGYDKDLFYINDPYSDSTISIEPQQFKGALGYEDEFNTVLVSARRSSR